MKSILIVSALALATFGKPSPVDPLDLSPEAIDSKTRYGYGAMTSTFTSYVTSTQASTVTSYTTSTVTTTKTHGHYYPKPTHHHPHHGKYTPSHGWFSPSAGLVEAEEPTEVAETPEQMEADEEVIQWELDDVLDDGEQQEASTSALIDLKRLFIIKKLVTYYGAVAECKKFKATIPHLKHKSELLVLAKFLYKKGISSAFVVYRGHPFIIRMVIKIVVKKTKKGIIKVRVVTFKIIKPVNFKAFIVCEKKKHGKKESVDGDLESIVQLSTEEPEVEDVDGDGYDHKKHDELCKKPSSDGYVYGRGQYFPGHWGW